MELFLVRHGRPEHIEDGDGKANPALTDIGQEQAEGVSEWPWSVTAGRSRQGHDPFESGMVV